MDTEREIVRSQKDKNDTERSAEIYLADLGLHWDDLRGKRILDIGAGGAEFATAAERRGVEVVSLDSADASAWEKQLIKIAKGTLFVIGKAELLPFADQSFDMVISHAAPPIIMTESKQVASAVINEAKRVLKSGGEYRFGAGNLDANVFRQEKDISNERIGTTEEQIGILREKSIEFLKSIDPRVEEIESKNPAYFRVGLDWYHFYSLKKSPEDAAEK